MPKNPLTRQLVIRISDELHTALEQYAEANERSIAQSVRYLLNQALDQANGKQD